MPSVNRFVRNGGRSLGLIKPQFKIHQTNRYPQNSKPSEMLLFCGYRLLCDLPPPVGGWPIHYRRSAMLSVNTPHAIDGLHCFGLLCRIAGLLFLFCMRLFWFAALYVLCCDWRFFFSLCERIFDFCLRSFAPAGATSPFQSQRAGPQRFLVLVRIWRCCSLEYKKQKENRKSSSPVNQNARSLGILRCYPQIFFKRQSAVVNALRFLLTQISYVPRFIYVTRYTLRTLRIPYYEPILMAMLRYPLFYQAKFKILPESNFKKKFMI